MVIKRNENNMANPKKQQHHTRTVNGKVISINAGIEKKKKNFEESIARSKALHPSSQPAPKRPAPKRIVTDIREVEEMAREIEEEEIFYSENDEDAKIIQFPVERTTESN